MEKACFEAELLRKHVHKLLGTEIRYRLVAGQCGDLVAEDVYFCDLRSDQRLLNYDVYRLLAAVLTEMVDKTPGGPFSTEFLVENDQYVRVRLCERRAYIETQPLDDPPNRFDWTAIWSLCWHS